MAQADALKTVLWRWGVPVVVLIVGLSAGFDGHTGASLVSEVALACGLAVPLMFRSRAPIAVFVLILVAVAAAEFWELDGSPGIPLAVLVASEAVGRHTEEPASWVAPLTVIVLALAAAFFFDRPPGEMALTAATMGGAWFLGRSLRLRAQFKSNQQEQAALLTQQAEERETEAAEMERARITRELHDIVGHATSLITIRLQALRRRLPSDDPTSEEIKSIEGDARQALADMRRLVAIMSDTETASRLEPPPGLGEIPGLVESMRKAGYTVDADIEGLPGDLNPGVQLAAYRVVQEALTNTIRHSGGSHVELSIAVDHENLRIDVKDDGFSSPGQHNGTGLVGMRQRAALYDGSVSAGPASDGGYRVRASLRIPQGSD
jgi:signal transduction histidine kinase